MAFPKQCDIAFALVGLVFVLLAPSLADASTGDTSLDLGGDGGSVLTLMESQRRLTDLHERGAPDLLDQRLGAETAPGGRAGEGGSGFLGLPSELPLGWRLLAETAGGAAIGTGGALVGAGVGAIFGVALLAGGSGSIHPQALVVLPAFFQAMAGIGATVGAYVFMPAGVWLGGKLVGGQGKFGWTYLGAAAGIGSAFGLGFLVGALSNDAFAGQMTGLVGMALLPVTGSFLGYELSHGAASRGRASTAPRIRPNISLRSSPTDDGGIDGATAGVAVQF